MYQKLTISFLFWFISATDLFCQNNLSILDSGVIKFSRDYGSIKSQTNFTLKKIITEDTIFFNYKYKDAYLSMGKMDSIKFSFNSLILKYSKKDSSLFCGNIKLIESKYYLIDSLTQIRCKQYLLDIPKSYDEEEIFNFLPDYGLFYNSCIAWSNWNTYIYKNPPFNGKELNFKEIITSNKKKKKH